MNFRVLFWFLLSSLIVASAIGQSPAPVVLDEKITIKTKVTAKDYENLLSKLKAGDKTVNFAKLRLAYTETKEYKPYGGTDLRNRMFEAVDKKDYKEALKAASTMLETNYVDLTAHWTSAISHEALGNKKDSDFHLMVLKGLISAILENNGLTETTAMISIGISEQYFVMSYMGYQRQSKDLVRNGGSTFDVHTSLNSKTNDTRKFYFNIDKVFGRF